MKRTVGNVQNGGILGGSRFSSAFPRVTRRSNIKACDCYAHYEGPHVLKYVSLI